MKENLFPRTFHVAIAGHVDHGKSTIIGHLLELMGYIKQRDVERYAIIAEQIYGDKSARYSIMTYSSLEEKERQLTLRNSYYHVYCGNKRITLIDTPGHYNYINRMIYGIIQSDATILVVDITQGLQDQTFDVINCLRLFPNKLIGIAITKMDLVKYDINMYKNIVTQLKSYLNECNFDISRIHFFPCSGLTGEGLIDYNTIRLSDDNALRDFLEKIEVSTFQQFNKLQFVVRKGNIYLGVPGIGVVLCGMVESGTLKRNEELFFEPASTLLQEDIKIKVDRIANVTTKINKKISLYNQVEGRAFVGLSFKGAKKIFNTFRQKKQIKGLIGTDSNNKPIVSDIFTAELQILWHPTIITNRYIFRMNNSIEDVEAKIIQILKKRTLNREDQKYHWSIKPNLLSYLKNDDIAIVRIQTKKRIAFDRDINNHVLNSFIMRDSTYKRVIGYGMIKKS